MTSFVGLTGGIASGKSSVSRLFAARGVPIVDADLVAREIVAPGEDGLRAIVEAFGDDVLGADGALDRPRLAAKVFSDPEARKRLDAITHPRIALRSMQKMAAVASTQVPYGIYDAALLVENGTYRAMAALVVVAATRETQLARLVARDGIDEAAAEARLRAQLPLEQKLTVADYIIWNDGSLAMLEARVDELHRTLTTRFSAL